MSELERSYNMSAGDYDDRGGALRIRLDASQLLENIELYLSSTMIKVLKNDETGQIYHERVQFAKPKANEEGIQSILSILQSILNTQIVQGNFLMYEDYERYIEELNTDLAVNFMVNRINWGISEDNYNVIIDQIMLALIPFMTRLIHNKERESYTETIKTVESASIRHEQSNEGFKLFKGGNKE